MNSASKEESRIKNLSREEKLGLIKKSLYTKTTNNLTTKTMGKGDNRQQKNKKKPKQNKKK